MHLKQQIPHHPSEYERANQRLFWAAVSVSFKNYHRAKKVRGVKEKDGGFSFTVNKASTPPSSSFCRLAGSISDWVQDQKQELFLPLLRQTKALTLLSPLLSFLSSLSLSSLSTLSLSRMPIEYTQYHTLSLSSFRYCALCLLSLVNRSFQNIYV